MLLNLNIPILPIPPPKSITLTINLKYAVIFLYEDDREFIGAFPSIDAAQDFIGVRTAKYRTTAKDYQVVAIDKE